MVQLCATGCSCIAILWVSLVSFDAITLCVTSQWVLIFRYDTVRKLLDIPSYFTAYRQPDKFNFWLKFNHRYCNLIQPCILSQGLILGVRPPTGRASTRRVSIPLCVGPPTKSKKTPRPFFYSTKVDYKASKAAGLNISNLGSFPMLPVLC
jgi:hypothetical protein